MKGFIRLMAALLAVFLLPQSAHAAQPTVAGKSAVLMECATGTVLCQQNPHEKLAPASVTKIMTMLLIMEALDSGQISLTDTVTASEAAAAKGGSQVYLKVGETMTVSDMLKSIAVSSANDCACAMAEHLAGSESAFVERMNRRAQELGMTDTHFVNCTGLDDGPEADQHRTSAWDIAIMSRELLNKHPGIKEFTTIWMDTIRGGSFGLSNTNKLVRFYPGATGLKTGFTSGAGYCLSATAQRDGMELIAVVMGAESSQVRNAACKQLLDYGFATFARVDPALPEQALVPVRLGTQDHVEVVLNNPGGILIDKAQKASVAIHTQLDAQADAPVSQGQRLGTLTIQAGDQIISQLPLVAKNAVPRMGYGAIWVEIMKRAAMAGETEKNI